jgi:hypothetical protein
MTVRAALLGAAALAGCSGSADVSGRGAHVVFLVRPECRTVVARTLAAGSARAFTVLTLDPSDYAPRAGDILEGPARAGRSVFLYYPEESLATRAGGESLSADVVAVGLDASKARERLDALCPAL